MRRILSSAAALLLVALALPAQGREDEPVWQDSWTCGGRIEITKRLVDVAALEEGELLGYGGDASFPPFLVLQLREPGLGVVIAVQRPSGWIGIPIEASHWIQGAFIVRRGGRARLFTMHEVEGPGHEYRTLRTDDGFARVSCSTLEFPREVTSPESYLVLVDFNADASGRGVLVGSAEGDDERPASWYEYRTADGARTWSPPLRVPQNPGRRNGVYTPVEHGASLSALAADLERSVTRTQETP